MNIKVGDYIRLKNNEDVIRHMVWKKYQDKKYKILAIFDNDYSGYGEILIESDDPYAWLLGSLDCVFLNKPNISSELHRILSLIGNIKCWWVRKDMILSCDSDSNNLEEERGGLSFL